MIQYDIPMFKYKNRGGLERSGGFWMTELAEVDVDPIFGPGWELAAGSDGYGCPYSKWQFKLQLLYGYGLYVIIIWLLIIQTSKWWQERRYSPLAGFRRKK